MTRLVRWDPFKELEDLHREVFGNEPGALKTRSNVPTADVFTEDNKLVTRVQLPDFKEDEVDVNIHNGMLEIRAERSEKDKEERDKRNYVIRESSSSFYRSFTLPKHYKEDEIEAHFEDGVLRVEVPLKEGPKPKKISIKSKGKSKSKKK